MDTLVEVGGSGVHAQRLCRFERRLLEWAGSHHGVLVVYRPLAPSVGLQLVVRVPLGNDGSVGVAEEGPPSHGLAPSQKWRRRFGRSGSGVRKLVALRLVGGAGGGVAGARGGAGGGGGLAGAAGQAAVSQAGLRAPTMERERDEESAGKLT